MPVCVGLVEPVVGAGVAGSIAEAVGAVELTPTHTARTSSFAIPAKRLLSQSDPSHGLYDSSLSVVIRPSLAISLHEYTVIVSQKLSTRQIMSMPTYTPSGPLRLVRNKSRWRWCPVGLYHFLPVHTNTMCLSLPVKLDWEVSSVKHECPVLRLTFYRSSVPQGTKAVFPIQHARGGGTETRIPFE
jgi:hypothetical protein